MKNKRKVILVVSTIEKAMVVKKSVDLTVNPSDLGRVSMQLQPGDTILVYSITDVFNS